MDLIIFTKDAVLTEAITGGIYPHVPTQQVKAGYAKEIFSYLEENKNDYRIATNSNREDVYYGTKNDAFLMDEYYYFNKNLGFHADFFIASKDLGFNVSVMRNWELGGALEDQLWNLEPGNFGTDSSLWGTFQKPNPGMPLLTEQLCKYFFDGENYERKIYVGIDANFLSIDKQAAEQAGFEFFRAYEFVEEFINNSSKSSKSDKTTDFNQYIEKLPSRRIGKKLTNQTV